MAVIILGCFGCGTKATLVEECRQIELARCRSAAECGLVPDEAACRRYVDDQCRHGFPGDLGPSKSDVQACAEAIEDIATCADRSGGKTDPNECKQSSLHETGEDRVCDLVERPEKLADCRFLQTDEEDFDAALPAEQESEETTPPGADAAADAAVP